ncbi:MAG: hypothetical protein J6R32_02830, partial [Bacteroidales bacterium]|nr:hypothetical protein [Bacteroidales bacterium]
RDGMSYFQNFGWTLIVLWALPVILWFLTYISMETFDTGIIINRDTKISTLMWLSLMIVPSRLYKNYNDSRKGVILAMTPASSLEKFLSMILYCVVITPIVYLIGALFIDTILALKPGTNPYEGFIISDFFTKNYESYREILSLGDEELNRSIYDYMLSKNHFIYKVLQILGFSSVFMFTNMLFKKRKLSKTIGILTLLGIIFSIFVVRYAINLEYNFDADWTDEEITNYVKGVVNYAYNFIFYSSLISASAFLYLTYYKIKKQTY